MAVAPSFQNFEFLTEPYLVGDKMYIKVRNPKTGTERQVRWYSDKEASKMGKKATSTVDHSKDPYWKPQKEVLGFTNGYITIFRGEDTYENKDWFKAHGARYTRWWGWYIISTMPVPEELPEGITAMRLNWEIVGQEDGSLKNDDALQKALDEVLYEQNGEFVGEIGDKLELWVTVEKAIELDGAYGRSTMHIMYDDDANVYVWTTAAKSWSEGTEHHIRGSVKDHRIYKGTRQTILTRCREVN